MSAPLATSAGRRWRGATLLSLSLLTVVGWIATPGLLRHLAYQAPLLTERVALVDLAPAGGRAFRADLEPTRWGPGWIEVREDGRPLEWVASGRLVRERGAGAFTVLSRTEGLGVLLAARDDSDPRANGRRYTVLRPRELDPGPVGAWIAAFVLLNATTLVLVALGLWQRGALATAPWIGLAGAAGVAVLWGLDGRLPESSDDLLGEKLRQHAAVADRVDTVFLGSSRVYRHLDPAAFDATFAEHGRHAHSFNLGVPDMRMLETLYLAERLLRREPSITRLIVEAESDPLFVREENRETQRVRRWHDPGTVRRALPAILGAGAPWPERALAALDRLELFAWRASLVGRGLDGIDALLDRPARWIEPELRGFLSLDADRRAPRTERDREGLERRWRELHEAVPDWRRTVARLRLTSSEGHPTDAFELELFAELEALAARRGVELAFVLSPRPERRPNLVHAAEAGIIGRLVRFDDPARYPDFYALAGRYDRHHLDEQAARRMTRLLALELLGVTDAPPGEASIAAPGDAAP
ncbi:MAG TPA: hypothetical protein VMV46_21420 [Thermoanaerobaculia bacterium]|nr:hypothetical protein [Thermoanaerobaculia bacterium]